MIKVSKVVDTDVDAKVDLAQLKDYLQTLSLPDTFVCIVCTTSTLWQEDEWEEDGDNFIIKVSHDEISDSDNPFDLIREAVDKRLRQTA